MDRLRVRRPSRFLHFIISDRADACGPIFIFICTDLYYWIPIILVAGIVILPFYLSSSPSSDDTPRFIPSTISSLSLSPSLFSFTFTLSFLVAATKLSAKGGDLRPPLPDSSTSNRLVWNHFSIIVTPPSIVSDIYIYYAARAILRSLSFLSRYTLDIIINFGM